MYLLELGSQVVLSLGGALGVDGRLLELVLRLSHHLFRDHCTLANLDLTLRGLGTLGLSELEREVDLGKRERVRGGAGSVGYGGLGWVRVGYGGLGWVRVG